MNPKERKIDLDDAIRAVRADEPDAGTLSQAAARVSQRVQLSASEIPSQTLQVRGCEDVQRLLPAFRAGKLPSERTLVIEMHLRDCVACRRIAHGKDAGTEVDWTVPVPMRRKPQGRLRFAFALAAATVAFATFFVYSAYLAIPAGARARVQSLDGLAYRTSASGEVAAKIGDELAEGETLRTTAGGHAYVRLMDGSIVEVRERSEFAVQARGRNLTIAMNQGSVIVQAAHRRLGHLYVRTPDARVAVTGTVFSVSSGVKGSRVAVIEGTVRVAHSGAEDVLHAGDQVATSDNMSAVPVSQEIAWSRDRDKHLALLAQFAVLRQRLAQIPLPPPRYNSELLNRVPQATVLYISIPNLGSVLDQANTIFQEQLRISPALRDWWQHGNKQGQEDLNSAIANIRTATQYLGEEVVVVGINRSRTPSDSPGLAVIAGVQRQGLADFLKAQFSAKGEHPGLLVVRPEELNSLTPAAIRGHAIALVRDSEVVFSDDLPTVNLVNAQLNAGSSGFSDGEFGRQVSEAYDRGAGFLLAADLGRILGQDRTRTAHKNKELEQSGFNSMRYLIAEHREFNGLPENHLDVQFEGPRRGVASWLAAPAPMGSLDFISSNAALSMSLIAKEPQAILDDILAMATSERHDAKELDELESKLQLHLREDLAAQFGGDVAFAIDGPVLPSPSWKLIVEVHDANRVQEALQRIVQAVNNEQQKPHPNLAIGSEEVAGQRFYRLYKADTNEDILQYTFADGYMVAGPNRAVLMASLKTHAGGDSLARSSSFRALLPKDQNLDYSAIGYQNLGPILQPLLDKVGGEQAAAVRQLAADARPTVICAWGRENRIEAASNSRLLNLDIFSMFSLFALENKTAVKNVEKN